MFTQLDRGEAGQATAEYAVATVGACGLAGALLTLATGDWWSDWLIDLLRDAYAWWIREPNFGPGPR